MTFRRKATVILATLLLVLGGFAMYSASASPPTPEPVAGSPPSATIPAATEDEPRLDPADEARVFAAIQRHEQTRSALERAQIEHFATAQQLRAEVSDARARKGYKPEERDVGPRQAGNEVHLHWINVDPAKNPESAPVPQRE